MSRGAGAPRYAFAVRQRSGSTRVRIGAEALGDLGTYASGSRVVLVADRRVLELHGRAIRRHLRPAPVLGELALPAGERAKTAVQVVRGWRELHRLGVRKDDCLVALGGGAALDLAGFLASTWMRGIDWIVLPSTLVAQADACLGGKTGIDLGAVKNLVGTFHPPRAALIDVRLLETVPERDHRAALFELLKCAWLGDAALGRLALSEAMARREPRALAEAVARALAIKARLVASDERDGAGRRLLNLGHTFGHALEAAGGLSRLRHGEAVGLGLLCAAHASLRLGLIDRAGYLRRRAEVLALGPPRIDAVLLARARTSVLLDKKRSRHGLTLILPAGRAARLHEGVSPAWFAGSLGAALVPGA